MSSFTRALKALVNGLIVAYDVSWAAQTGKYLLRTRNVSEQNQKHFLGPGHKICVRNKSWMLRARANGETFVSATMCPQQCVLVCQDLKTVRVNCLFWDIFSFDSDFCTITFRYPFCIALNFYISISTSTWVSRCQKFKSIWFYYRLNFSFVVTRPSVKKISIG